MTMHVKVLLSVSVLSATLLVGSGSRVTAADSRAAFEGVWKTVEVVVPGPTPQTSDLRPRWPSFREALQPG
jgi:hypothetical protein